MTVYEFVIEPNQQQLHELYCRPSDLQY